MNIDQYGRYFATDVETTGTNPKVDLLLQVAVIITDQRMRELAEYNAIISHPEPQVTHWRKTAPQVVIDMHEKTGLWDRVLSDEAKPMDQVEQELIALAQEHTVAPNKTLMLGSSVHFDRAFLMENMPTLVSDHLHYRICDVSTLAHYANTYHEVPYYEKKREHEAMADIRESINEFMHVYTHIEGGI